jgi:hypothetical protein
VGAVTLLLTLLWSVGLLVLRFTAVLVWSIVTQPPGALHSVVPIAMMQPQLDEVGDKYGVDRADLGLSSGHASIEDADDLVDFGIRCRDAAEGIEMSGGMWQSDPS